MLHERIGLGGEQKEYSAAPHPTLESFQFGRGRAEFRLDDEKHAPRGWEMFQGFFPPLNLYPEVFQPEVKNLVPSQACAVSGRSTWFFFPVLVRL
jgi:hypothetical protein